MFFREPNYNSMHMQFSGLMTLFVLQSNEKLTLGASSCFND